MTHVTCRLTATIRDQLRNPVLSNRVWASFTLSIITTIIIDNNITISVFRFYLPVACWRDSVFASMLNGVSK